MKRITHILICTFLMMSILAIASVGTLSAAPIARIQTSKGEIVIDLNSEKAPKTVANFLAYAKAGFYDKTIFHRVIKGFMIQGGGLTDKLQKKDTKPPVQNEADNGLKNLTGTIAMARTQAPHSATAQFFINVADNTPLDFSGKNQRGWGYCVFGKVIKGMEVVKAIEASPTASMAGRGDVPVNTVLIKKVIIDTPKKK